MLCCNLNFHQQIRVQFYCDMDTQQVQWLRYHLENRDSCKHVPLRDMMTRASSKTDLSPWWWIMSIFFKHNRNTLSIIWTHKAKCMFMCMHVCVCVCIHVWCFFMSLHLLIGLITDLLSASHSMRRKNKLLGHMKRSRECLHTHTHTCSTHLSQFRSVTVLFDSLPAGDLSFIVSTPWSLVLSLALPVHNISLPVSTSVSVYFALTVGGKLNLLPEIPLYVLFLLSIHLQ